MDQELEKGRDIWLELGLPDYVPNVIFSLLVKFLLNLIGLLDCESGFQGIPPMKNVLFCTDSNFFVSHCF